MRALTNQSADIFSPNDNFNYQKYLKFNILSLR